MQVIHAHEPMPAAFTHSLFLAGPSPRAAEHADWRTEALALLAARGYDGVVFTPLPLGGFTPLTDYDSQVAWEQAAMERSDQLIFWIPRDLEVLPGFTTNVEWGRWEASGRVVLGYPPGAPKLRYLDWHARRCRAPVCHTLAATLDAALTALGPPALRQGAETGVPLEVWRAPVFQAWYATQRAAGNRLDGARLEWAWRAGRRRHLVFWALQVDVHVAAEGRNKSSELVLGRPDIAAIVLHEPGPVSDATRVVLVREFRACGRAADGYVHELPGGSSFTPTDALTHVAVEELAEELGLTIAPERLRLVGQRSVAATLSAHQAAVFAVALTPDELDKISKDPGPYGLAAASEVTWPEVRRLGELRAAADVDWANLGMILEALSTPPAR